MLNLLHLPPMKISKHIFFRLLFLVAVLFCLGLEVYTNYSTFVCNTALSSNQDSEENIDFSNTDSIEDENINQGHCIIHLVEQLMLIPFSNELLLLKEHHFLSWQPPKLA